jgi:hypothetical protein
MLAVIIDANHYVPIDKHTGKTLSLTYGSCHKLVLGTLVKLFNGRLYSHRGAKQKFIVPRDATLYRNMSGYWVRNNSSQLELKFVDLTNRFRYRRENRPSNMKS